MRPLRAILFTLLLHLCDSTKAEISSRSIEDIVSPDKVVEEFYHWYLDNYYNNDYKIITPQEKIKDGKLYLDTAGYMSIIRNSDFFSQKYITGQIELFKICNEEISNIRIQDYEECACSPADMVSGCNFMLYYNWLYHQGEETKDILIKETKIHGSSATVDIELLSDKGDTKGYQNLRLTLDKENGDWRISDIANVP